MSANIIKPLVRQVLELLAKHKNVLIVGPPATGKSLLMGEVRAAFKGSKSPTYDQLGEAPFPPAGSTSLEEWMPSHTRAERHDFQITFHQGTKHRDFVSGITPRLHGSGTPFEATQGVLLQANQKALTANSASLLTIDEINRGPAVAIFGDALVAVEADKRLGLDDKPIQKTGVIYAYTPDGTYKPHHLSMNEADTSVEPLDVAFQRRFHIFRLEPDPIVARQHLGLASPADAPPTATDPKHVYAALLAAWETVNAKIILGRSRAFQIGHGVLMLSTPPSDVDLAIGYALEAWRRVEAHIDELFFGNDAAKAVVFNAGHGKGYTLEEAYFGEQPVSRLVRPVLAASSDAYAMLRSVAGL
jgi:5-methylcytosine-specific restriction enzyme B